MVTGESTAVGGGRSTESPARTSARDPHCGLLVGGAARVICSASCASGWRWLGGLERSRNVACSTLFRDVVARGRATASQRRAGAFWSSTAAIGRTVRGVRRMGPQLPTPSSSPFGIQIPRLGCGAPGCCSRFPPESIMPVSGSGAWSYSLSADHSPESKLTQTRSRVEPRIAPASRLGSLGAQQIEHRSQIGCIVLGTLPRFRLERKLAHV